MQALGPTSVTARGKPFCRYPIGLGCPKKADIARVLSKNADLPSIKFVWPLLKDMLGHCQCIVSGSAIEIEPYVAPLDMFGSYWNSKRRVFMSATVTNDAFLVRGLRLAPSTIEKPLGYDQETWAGERMLLLPSLIHEDLSRASIVKKFAVANPRRTFGVVALAPSASRTQDWKKYGATVADKGSVGDTIKQLKAGAFESTVVLVNRYDGIDLPDDACRVLIFDSKPYTESLPDLYQELCRPNSDATLMRIVRTIEQGMGRSVRGEKDYCVVIATGTDLVRILRDRTTREYFSPQMNAQIDLGFEIAELAKQDIETGKDPFAAFVELISQCVRRDGDWKEFYVSRMNEIAVDRHEGQILQSYVAELDAATAYMAGDYEDAANTIQTVLDKSSVEVDDHGWYLQEMARYNWRGNRAESERLQKAAHKSNRKLLRLPTMATITKLTTISQKRIERIAEWVKDRGDYSGLEASISDVLSDLTFGTKADRFERALNELGHALGFDAEQPDKDWKAGPDNLWALNDEWYLLWECKSEVSVTRADIHKREAEQMNRSSAWFERYYSGARVKRLIVHPTHKIHRSAAFTHEVEVVRVAELQKLTKAVREFFKNSERLDFRSLSTRHIQTLVDSHGLSVESLLAKYSRRLRVLAGDPAN